MARRRTQGEGTVYKDESRDRWVGQAWIAGRRRKVSAKTKAECAAKLGRLQHGDESERRADRRITVAGLLTDWQAKALPGRNLAPSTIETHAWAVAIWTQTIGRVRLADLDAPMIENAMGKMDLSRASLVKARSTLNQALRWAERRRLVGYNAAGAAELPASAEGTKPRTALTPDQLDALLDVLEGHPFYAMFLTMARVGLRPGEAAGLCRDALDLKGDPPTVAVVRAVRLEKGRPVLVDVLKTDRSRRSLAIPGDVVKALTKPARGTRVPTHPIFTGERNGGPLWPSSVRGVLADACIEADIPVISPNALRHTAATHLVDGGLAPYRVADILGHTDTRMIDRTYRHRPDVIRGAEG